jgi:hypothetical protein
MPKDIRIVKGPKKTIIYSTLKKRKELNIS